MKLKIKKPFLDARLWLSPVFVLHIFFLEALNLYKIMKFLKAA